MLNKESIVQLLKTNDKAVARALLVLNERQTSDEQASENTRYLNGCGFRPCHARMGTSMAKFYQRNGYLSPKQLAYWRAHDKSGSMRIGIYHKQLLEVAQEKTRQKQEEQNAEKARLEYELGMVMDSDDPVLIDAAQGELDSFMQRLQKKI